MAFDAERAAKAYQDAMGSGRAQSNYKAGISATTENPMAKAASPEALSLYQQRTAESVTSGRRAAKLQAVPFQRWKDNAINVGAARLASGAVKAMDKMRGHFQKFGPVYENIRATVRSMPKGTREDSKARSNRAIDMLMDAAGR